MTRALALATLLAAAPAAAQPDRCSVEVVRAPEEVRAFVDDWLAHGQRCGVALEVRVVPTEGGLYVFARDDRGGVRDRVVPDAQTAGALIASWADAGQPPPVVPVAVDVRAEVDLRPIADPAAFVDRGQAPRQRRPGLFVAQLGSLGTGKSMFQGLRAQVDVLRGETWRAGAYIGFDGVQYGDFTAEMGDVTQWTDVAAGVYVARPVELDGWEVQPAVGIGVVHTHVIDQLLGDPNLSFSTLQRFDRVSPTAEASVFVSHALIGTLGVTAGVIATAYEQQFPTFDSNAGRRFANAVFSCGFRFGFL